VRILFLEIDHEADWAVASIGAAFIGAYLREHGHESSMHRVAYDAPLDGVVDHVRAVAPDLIGVSLTSRQWLRAREVVGYLRERVDTPVIAGGLHPTFASHRVLATPGFDYACLGEGEVAMLELVEALEAGGFPREGIRSIGARGGPPPLIREPFEPIDALPFMARDHLDEHPSLRHFVTQRGCPFPCTYCAARQFSDLYDDGYKSYGRRRSLDNVKAEFEQICDGLGYVIFLDDTFTINHAWIREFCAWYRAEVGVGFSLHARVETVNPRMLEELADAGCRHITYGVESGSERVRRDIMKRFATNEQFERVFRWTQDVGIMATANYIIGTPGETRDDIELTLALHDRLAPTDFGYFVFYPYEGTELFRVCRDNGYLPDDYEELPANHRRSILRLPDLTPDDIEHYYERFTEVHVRDTVSRLGTTASAEDRAIAESMIRDRAAVG
jgi:radical SAM superfamily enzyme YgiQ (UPF0313 family)